MDGFIVRVKAYHGEPVLVGKFHTRSSVFLDEPLQNSQVVNVFEGGGVVDLNGHATKTGCTYNIECLIEDFQDEYGCKVNIEDTECDGMMVHEFDVFEPSWPERQEARDVQADLMRRIVDWVQGYPTGR